MNFQIIFEDNMYLVSGGDLSEIMTFQLGNFEYEKQFTIKNLKLAEDGSKITGDLVILTEYY